MVQPPKSTIRKNVLAWRGCEKLYLDERTADVFFVFNSKIASECKRVPAHKNILSSVSDVMYAMFYGPVKESGDININDTSPEAFEEFLQYFYRSSVKLTSENAVQVINLCKQYLLNDCIKNSTDLVESSLTLDNMCWGYELALLFEEDNLKEFCEQQITENPEEIFQSTCFLTCEPNLMRHILQLDFKCDETLVFDGCVEWAKTACVLKGIDEKNVNNLRTQLGDLFYDIFRKMSLSNFFKCYESYVELFSLEDYRDITMMISRSKEIDSNCRSINKNHSDNDNLIICERIVKVGPLFYGSRDNRNIPVQKTTFSSNFPLTLKRFYCRKLCKNHFSDDEMQTPVKIRIMNTYQGDVLTFIEVSLSNSNETIVELPAPIVIKRGIKYRIEFMSVETEDEASCVDEKMSKLTSVIQTQSRATLNRSDIECDEGIVISFYNTDIERLLKEMVSRMDFKMRTLK